MLTKLYQKLTFPAPTIRRNDTSYRRDRFGQTFLSNQAKGEKTMKKLLSVAFIMLSMIFVSLSVDAAPVKKLPDMNAKTKIAKNERVIIDTYRESKIIWLFGKKYLNVYRVNVFQNGATNRQLINSVNLSNRFYQKQGRVKTNYKTKIIWKNGRQYRVTKKITKFRNGGQKKQLINKVRLW
jgi:hypothetical protein